MGCRKQQKSQLTVYYPMESISMNEKQYNLAEIEADCWQRMVNGALQSNHPYHHPVVANPNTNELSMRTVVLRDASSVAKKLTFYTDIRTGKWLELQQNPAIGWLFYDQEKRIQIRASGKASLHQNDELANDAWRNTKAHSRKNYSCSLSPSAEIIIPQNGLQEGMEVTAQKNGAGRGNFGVVVSTIRWMEWLWLNNQSHYRAKFIYDEKGNFTGSWLVP